MNRIALRRVAVVVATIGTFTLRARADEPPSPSASPATATAPEPLAANDAPAVAPRPPVAAPEPEKPSDEPPPKKRWSTPVGLRLDGGYSPRRLLAIPLTGADLGLAVGAQPMQHAAFWGASRLFIGSTENGLKVFSVRVGGDIDAVIDRFRIGGGVNVFLVGVGRAVRDETIYSWGPAAHAAARFDVLQSTGFAIFARGSIDAGYEIYNGTIFWGPSVGAGVDFDVAGTRDAQ